MTQRLIVGISGASGIIYGVRALQLLRSSGVETHLVITPSAQLTLHHEMDMSLDELKGLATEVHAYKNIGASIASGSFNTGGMLIAPCSVRSMSEVATGVTSSLLTRAADVVLKERRRLVMMLRETPLHSGHLRSMTQLSEMGAVIAPPVPAFYTRPKSIDDMVTQSVGRVLDLFGLNLPEVERWQGA
ncbi:UbiX family flavin prenyltransferase [Parahaliea sp. F7430]|uniref:Flavin prenyltransferase UbiX n=1 Tax=Sediminihaliea albiluteola TaxID=2758564 RepID=A0A7W2YJV8_9GAMM|nr:UbiX family flavin prenyltransferase [Sediminihaliea albiluteola]MBA6413497.1 UbiX family flavin prenyltransferase [Sediminihaliea albiluteola]